MIRLIGTVAFETDGPDGQGPVRLDLGPLGQVALGYLVLERRREVRRDELAEVLWGDALPATWRASLRGVIARLREAIGEMHLDAVQVVTAGSGTYRVSVSDDVTIDVEDVAGSLRAAETAIDDGDAFRARILAARVVDRSVGEFLPAASGEWVEHRRDQVREMHVRGLEVLSEAAAAVGDHAVAIHAAESAVHLAPLRESAHLRAMMAHSCGGNRAQALQAYQRCRRILEEEIGVSPGARIEATYLQLLSHDGTPSAKATPRRPVGQLPASVDSFVGRTREAAAIKERLASGRLVTLTGPPGVGKSRLALEVARSLAPHYPDGIHLLDLADVTDAHGLRRLMSTTFVDERGRDLRPIGSLLEALADDRALLVLDNCDPAACSCASLANDLLRQAPNLRILVTSREPLEAAGEILVEVPPLPVPDSGASVAMCDLIGNDAVRLFLDRAAAVAPELEPDPDALVQICVQLDGLPLAIELAAARTRTLTLGQIADRLQDRFRLLASGDPATSPRNTLGAALDWSYGKLDEDERRLLEHVSVFVGGFSLQAVEWLCADHVPGIPDVLSSLVKKSLVRVDRRANANRYDVLKTIREYASRKLLISGEDPDVRNRHAAWVAQLTAASRERLDGPGQTDALRLLATEHGNVTAALQWLSSDPRGHAAALRIAVSIWRFWEVNGHFEEGRFWLERLAVGDVTTRTRADALNSAAILAHHLSDTGAARRLYEQSLAIRRDLGDDLGVAATINGLAHLDVSEGAYAKARRRFEENLVVADRLGDESLIAATLMNLGVVEQLLWEKSADDGPGNADRARLLLTRARVRFESLGNVRGAAQCLENLGSLALLEGARSGGRDYLAESLVCRRSLGDRPGIAECVRFLGRSAFEQDAYRSSQAYLEECAALWRQMGNPRRTAEVLVSLAEVADAQGHPSEARSYLREGLRLYVGLADQAAVDRVLEQLESVAF